MAGQEGGALVEGGEEHGLQFTVLRAVVGALELLQQELLGRGELFPEGAACRVPLAAPLLVGGAGIVALKGVFYDVLKYLLHFFVHWHIFI